MPGRRDAGSPSHILRLIKVVCLASPQVAVLPGRRVAESKLIVLQLRLHDLGSPGCRVALSPGCRVTEMQYNARLHINAKVALSGVAKLPGRLLTRQPCDGYLS